jgi:hypothetical protein
MDVELTTFSCVDEQQLPTNGSHLCFDVFQMDSNYLYLIFWIFSVLVCHLSKKVVRLYPDMDIEKVFS